jgi:uncharacterized protein DUF4268
LIPKVENTPDEGVPAPDGTFWQQFIARAQERGLLPAKYHLKEPYYLNFGAGRRGLKWGYQRRKNGTRVNLHVYLPGREKTMRLFDRLAAHEEEIHAAFGDRLAWEVNRSGATIAFDLPDGGSREDERDWSLVHDAMLDAMARFQAALAPWVAGLEERRDAGA